MNQLKTIFSSNFPVDCHILKGRLESEGVTCYIYDENTILMHPFRAVTIGGVKLKIPEDQLNKAIEIINLLNSNLLIDSSGIYPLEDIYNNEIKRQNNILDIKRRLREEPGSISHDAAMHLLQGLTDDPEFLLREEASRLELSKKKFTFSWKQFLYELLDPDGNIFKYFRTKPTSYYIDNEILDNYCKPSDHLPEITCNICGSENVIKSMAIDYKWNFLQVITIIFGALLGMEGFFISRVKYHCFNCGNNFSMKTEKTNKQ